MNIKTSFQNLDHTESLDLRIQEKSKHLAKYLDGRTTLKWTCSLKNGTHIANVIIIGPTFCYMAHANDKCLYKALDQIIGKLTKQLDRKKDLWKNHIHHKHEVQPVMLDPEDAWASHEEEYFDDVG